MEEYFSEMTREARDVMAAPDMARFAMIRDLRPEFRTYVMQQNPRTTAELLEAAKVADATVIESGPPVSSEILEAINRLEQRVAASVDDKRPPGNRRQSQTVTGTIWSFVVDAKTASPLRRSSSAAVIRWLWLDNGATVRSTVATTAFAVITRHCITSTSFFDVSTTIGIRLYQLWSCT